MCLANVRAFREQMRWCFEHLETLQRGLWLDLGVYHKWWVVSPQADG